MSRLTIADADIHYKNIKFLKRCLTEHGKIVPARLTGLACHQQRKMTRATKQARFLALLPYSV